MKKEISKIVFYVRQDYRRATLIFFLIILIGLKFSWYVPAALLTVAKIWITAKLAIANFKNSRQEIICDHCWKIFPPNEVALAKRKGEKNNPRVYICNKGIKTEEYTLAI